MITPCRCTDSGTQRGGKIAGADMQTGPTRNPDNLDRTAWSKFSAEKRHRRWISELPLAINARVPVVSVNTTLADTVPHQHNARQDRVVDCGPKFSAYRRCRILPVKSGLFWDSAIPSFDCDRSTLGPPLLLGRTATPRSSSNQPAGNSMQS